MPKQSLARGAFLALVAAAFGLTAATYRIGSLSAPGPGLFPILVSGLLMVLAVVTIAQSRLAASPPLYVNLKNIGLIMGALIGFVLVAKYLSMLAAIVVLVFVASFAGTSVSWKRSLAVTAGLVVIAFAFQRFLGLNLKLY